MMGFPKGDRYQGTEEQNSKLESQFLRKAEFMTSNNAPIWNGEFGPVYANPALDKDHEEVNAARINLVGQQLKVYDKFKINWTIWLYKDIGLQGMIHTNPESKWMKTIAPFLEKKRALQLDAWGRYPSKQVEDVINPLVEFIDKHIPRSKMQYPTPWATERQIVRLVSQLWMAGCLSDEFAEQFKDMSFDELDECARSFHFDECLQRDRLNQVLESHAQVTEEDDHCTRPVAHTNGVKLELD